MNNIQIYITIEALKCVEKSELMNLWMFWILYVDSLIKFGVLTLETRLSYTTIFKIDSEWMKRNWM